MPDEKTINEEQSESNKTISAKKKIIDKAQSENQFHDGGLPEHMVDYHDNEVLAESR